MKMIPSILERKTSERFYRKYRGKIHLVLFLNIITTTEAVLLLLLLFENLH
jgi:hypothetical protein